VLPGVRAHALGNTLAATQPDKEETVDELTLTDAEIETGGFAVMETEELGDTDGTDGDSDGSDGDSDGTDGFDMDGDDSDADGEDAS
jgi:hypothetical protein